MDAVFWATLLTLPILPNLWCIWHASRHAFPGPDEQKHWVRAGVFAPIIGGLLYLAIGMRRARPIPSATAPAFSQAAPENTTVRQNQSVDNSDFSVPDQAPDRDETK